MREIRGKDMAMIFQDPFACLHPMYRVGDQIAEAVTAHATVSKSKASDRAVEMLEAVGIPRARDRARDYPHQFSGGMRQRAMIAMALVNNPSVLIADEPTTALDVTVQAQILELIERVKREFDIGVILITHDLGRRRGDGGHRARHVRGPADGARAGAMRSSPLRSTRTPGGCCRRCRRSTDRLEKLLADRGLAAFPPPRPDGCPFNPRCAYAFAPCTVELPELRHDAGRPPRSLSPARRSGSARSGPSSSRASS